MGEVEKMRNFEARADVRGEQGEVAAGQTGHAPETEKAPLLASFRGLQSAVASGRNDHVPLSSGSKPDILK